MEFNTAIALAIGFTVGVALGKWATNYRWIENSKVSARLPVGKHFYKVVKLDSEKSLDYLDIHRE
jgi:hypothetical protein